MNKRTKGKGFIKLLSGVMALLLIGAGAGCGSDDDDSDINLSSYLALANTDYVAGQAAKIKVDEKGTFPAVQNSTTLDSDPGGMDITEKTGKETVFLVGRKSATIYNLDPQNSMEVRDSFTVGPAGFMGANPQDVLVLSADKAYVTRQADSYDDILIVDPGDGSTRGTIEFTGIPTNADSLARPADMVEANGKVFVAIQNLNAAFNYCEASIEPGMIAVIDPATDTVTDTVLLNKSNPTRLYYAEERGEVLVASAGSFATDSPGCPMSPDPDVSTSGLEAVSTSSPYAHYMVISGDHPDINGNIYDVAFSGDNTAYVLVAYGFNFEDRARKTDLATGTVDASFRYPSTNSGNDDLSGIQAAKGFLFIGDRTNSGVEVIETGNHTEVGFHDLDLPPMTMNAMIREKSDNTLELN